MHAEVRRTESRQTDVETESERPELRRQREGMVAILRAIKPLLPHAKQGHTSRQACDDAIQRRGASALQAPIVCYCLAQERANAENTWNHPSGWYTPS